MRTRRIQWLSVALLPSLINITTASPFALPETEFPDDYNSTVVKRCANPCGYYGQVCCEAGQSCYTDSNNEAQCGSQVTPAPQASPTGSGHWQYYTSIWVDTNTVTKTSIYSSFITSPAGPTSVPATQTAAAANCNWQNGESSCGNICCPSGQFCQVSGQCAPAVSSSSGSSESVSAPLRPTSSGNTVVVQTSYSTTTTVPFETPIATGQAAGASVSATATGSSSGGGLSGGAIAGIVIGVIAAIIILLLLLLCCCFKAGWDALKGIFGLGPRERRREVTEYEHVRRSGGSVRRGDRSWYGDRPSRIEEIERKEKKDITGLGWGGVAAGLGGLAVALGLKKRADERRAQRHREEKSEYTASSDSYSYSYGSESSDRRTRDTRRTSRR